MGAPNASHDQSVSLLAGACLGGGTVVNYSTSFRTPDDVRSEWAASGVAAFASEDYTRSLDDVCDRLGVNQEHNDPSTREQKLQEGCVKLGWHVDAMPRGVRQCAQGKECGYCGLGCRVGAKQSVVKTWLRDAHEAGTRMIVRTKVQRILVDGGAARGIVGRTVEGHHVTVRSRAVIAACGAIHTPALLKRSGLQNPNIGKHLKLHPASAVFGVFDEELKPWEGVMQALYSDEHRNLHDGYGLKYETAANHPHLFLAFSPWRGSREHFSLMESLSNSVPIGVLLRDRDGGEVRVGRDGEPVVRYKLSDFDAGHVRTGIDGAAQILEAAGARRIFSSQAKWVSYEPGAAGGRERFMADADAAGYGPGQLSMGSFHIMGSARMGGSPDNVGLRSQRADLGRAGSVRVRWLCVSQRLRRESADLDSGDRPHGRTGAGRAAELNWAVHVRAVRKRRGLNFRRAVARSPLARLPLARLLACPLARAVGYWVRPIPASSAGGVPMSEPAHVLIVAHQTAATPELLDAVRARAQQGEVTFHLVVPRQAHGMHKVVDPQDAGEDEAQQVLDAALPKLSEAAGSRSPEASATPSR